MRNFLSLAQFKRGPIWSSSNEDTMIPISDSRAGIWGIDGLSTPLVVEASQMPVTQTRATEPISWPEGLLGSLQATASASIMPAASSSAGENMLPTPVLTSSSITPESTSSQTTTSTFSPLSLDTHTILTSSVVASTGSTTSASETAAPGAYSGGGGSVKNKLAIAIPIAVVGLLIILALMFFFIRRRKHRTARPPYEMPGTITPGVSTAALMTTTPKMGPVPSSEPAGQPLPQLPTIDITASRSLEPPPASVSTRSVDDARTELGVAMAVPMDQRLSATEHNLRGFTRPVSSVSRHIGTEPPSAGLDSVRMPFENRHGGDHDAVSIISGELGRSDGGRDFDDLSSVSSFDDEHPRNSRDQTFQ